MRLLGLQIIQYVCYSVLFSHVVTPDSCPVKFHVVMLRSLLPITVVILLHVHADVSVVFSTVFVSERAFKVRKWSAMARLEFPLALEPLVVVVKLQCNAANAHKHPLHCYIVQLWQRFTK